MNAMIPSASSLQRRQAYRIQSKIDTFNIVLNKCIQKINYTNKNSEQTFIIFEVPKILIGYPLYDKNSCIIYIIENLVKEKYKVDFIEPCYLYIDWGVSITHNISVKEKIKREFSKQFPNTAFDIIYEDELPIKKKNKKNKK